MRQIDGEESEDMVHSLFLHGKCLHKFNQQSEKAIEVLQEAIAIQEKKESDSKGKNTLSRLIYTLGNVLFREGKVREAKESYQKARSQIIDIVENIDLVKEMDRNIKDCCTRLEEAYEEPQEEIYSLAESKSQFNNPYGSIG